MTIDLAIRLNCSIDARTVFRKTVRSLFRTIFSKISAPSALSSTAKCVILMREVYQGEMKLSQLHGQLSNY